MAEVVIDKNAIAKALRDADSSINHAILELCYLANDFALMSSEGMKCSSAKAPAYLAMKKGNDNFKELVINAHDSIVNLHSGLWGIAVGLAEGMDDNNATYSCTIEYKRPSLEMFVAEDSVKWEYSMIYKHLTEMSANVDALVEDLNAAIKSYQSIYSVCGENADFWSQLNDAANACRAIGLKSEEILKTFKEELTAALEARIKAGIGSAQEQKTLVDTLKTFAYGIDDSVNFTYQTGTWQSEEMKGGLGTWEGLDWAPNKPE